MTDRLNWKRVPWRDLKPGDVVHYHGVAKEYRAYTFMKWGKVGNVQVAILDPVIYDGIILYKSEKVFCTKVSDTVPLFMYAERRIFTPRTRKGQS